MYRYLVFVWNPRDEQERTVARTLAERLTASSPAWAIACQRPGCVVFESGSRPGVSESVPLPDEKGVVLGTLFRTKDYQRVCATFTRAEGGAIVKSRGEYLLRHCWGRYVAVAHDDATDVTWVLRDPSGGLPCLYLLHQGVHLFFSDVRDCMPLGLPSFTLNWMVLRAMVVNWTAQSTATALNQVLQVLPGEIVEIRAQGISRRYAWHPLEIAQRDPIENVSEAAAALRQVVRACVHAWARCYPGIVHRLSGGLDSSIVVSCLADMPDPPHIVCLHYASDDPRADEREYARCAVAGTPFELIEHTYRPDAACLERTLKAVRTERPRFLVYSAEHIAFERELAREHGATAWFTGVGGDSLFYQHGGAHAVVDHVYRHGFRFGVWQRALDAAEMDESVVWPIVARGLRGLFNRRADPFQDIGRHKQCVPAEIIRWVGEHRQFIDPRFCGVRGTPPGKLSQAMALSLPLPFYDPLGQPDDPECTMPLLSQPVIELCLRIPTYVLIHGGWDRAIARQAFAGAVPRKILRRRGKGDNTSEFKQLFDSHARFIREMLLDGLLVREGLLDRQKLEQHLRAGQPVTNTAFAEIMIEHFCSEVWARGWVNWRDPNPAGIAQPGSDFDAYGIQVRHGGIPRSSHKPHGHPRVSSETLPTSTRSINSSLTERVTPDSLFSCSSMMYSFGNTFSRAI